MRNKAETLRRRETERGKSNWPPRSPAAVTSHSRAVRHALPASPSFLLRPAPRARQRVGRSFVKTQVILLLHNPPPAQISPPHYNNIRKTTSIHARPGNSSLVHITGTWSCKQNCFWGYVHLVIYINVE